LRKTGGSEASVAGNESSSSTTSPDRRAGRLVVVSGPSGVGKTSVVDAVLDTLDIGFSVSATTRAPRPGEVDGVDYLFVTDAEFDELIEGDGLLEWAHYGGYRYGTPRDPVEASLARGEDILLDIENDGAGQVRSKHPEALLIFVAPPSLAELERRLRDRGDTSEGDIGARLAVAETQIEQAARGYDHIVINDELNDAIAAITSILLAPAPPVSDADASFELQSEPQSEPQGTPNKEPPRS
jgi:guanylate kinase